MDEKAMVSTNTLNAAYQAQLTKRASAPALTHETAGAHLAAVATPVAVGGIEESFCAAWGLYYPKVVSLLGWASWVIPGPTLTRIKALLAVVNNQIVPLVCSPK